jgi:Uma2 family endonuclease
VTLEPNELQQVRERHERLGLDAAHDVDEVLIVDPKERQVQWFALQDGEYKPVERSSLIELGPDELTERRVWPRDL